MSTESQSLTDRVFAVLDPGPAEHDPGARGPDAAQWDNPSQRNEPPFDPGIGVVKGPDPEQWL